MPDTARQSKMTEDEIGNVVLGCAIRVHKALGPGLLEGVYEACLAHEMEKSGLNVQRQVTMPVAYENIVLEVGYRLDLLVENAVVVEIKSVEKILPVHKAQTLSYLRLGKFRLGYVLNFNVTLLKEGICRVVNQL